MAGVHNRADVSGFVGPVARCCGPLPLRQLHNVEPVCVSGIEHLHARPALSAVCDILQQ